MKNKKIMYGAVVFVAVLLLALPVTVAMSVKRPSIPELPSGDVLPDWLTVSADRLTLTISDDLILIRDDFITTLPETITGEYGGYTSSLDSDGDSGLYVEAVPLVYTLTEANTEPPMMALFIKSENWLKETRDEHKGYILIPSIDVKKVELGSEWHNGYWLGGVYVPTDATVSENTMYGEYGFGKIFTSDSGYWFRLNLRLFIQNDDNPNQFDFADMDSDTGMWIIDLLPFPVHQESQINELAVQNVVMGGMIN